jgi:hypothetical protein
VTALSVASLATCKPDYTVDIDDDKNRKRNWGKIISISLVMGIVAGIIVFLLTMEKVPARVEDDIEPAKMRFSKNVSNCY